MSLPITYSIAFHPTVPGLAFALQHPGTSHVPSAAAYEHFTSLIIRIMYGYSLPGSGTLPDYASDSRVPTFVRQRIMAAGGSGGAAANITGISADTVTVSGSVAGLEAAVQAAVANTTQQLLDGLIQGNQGAVATANMTGLLFAAATGILKDMQASLSALNDVLHQASGAGALLQSLNVTSGSVSNLDTVVADSLAAAAAAQSCPQLDFGLLNITGSVMGLPPTIVDMWQQAVTDVMATFNCTANNVTQLVAS